MITSIKVKLPKPLVMESRQVCQCLRCGHRWKAKGEVKVSLSGKTLMKGPKKCAGRGCLNWWRPYIRRRFKGKDLPIAFGVKVEELSIRQTACKTCGQDIEGYGEPGEWRDRGGGTECLPYEEKGEIITLAEGTLHEAVPE